MQWQQFTQLHEYAKLAVQWQQFTQFPCLVLVSCAMAAVYSVSMFMLSCAMAADYSVSMFMLS